MKKEIVILGAGTWGIALARLLANKDHNVTVWSAIGSEIDNLNKTHIHPNLKEMNIPSSIIFEKDIEKAINDKEIIVVVVPSIFVRSTMKNAKKYIKNDQIIVCATKGIENDTLFTMSELIQDEITKDVNLNNKVVALSGPTHAEEVAFDLPTSIVSACEDIKTAEIIQDVFITRNLRVYTNYDIKGVELCGAVKNVIALASGMCTGLGFGDNAKAALITRGLVEMSRLGSALGCLEQTFSGLAGLGDLIVTATSKHSRNNKCGYLIGQGKQVDEAIKEVGMVVEGINALSATVALAKKYNVEMPIVFAVNNVVNNNMSIQDEVDKLFSREKKTELPNSAIK